MSALFTHHLPLLIIYFQFPLSLYKDDQEFIYMASIFYLFVINTVVVAISKSRKTNKYISSHNITDF